MTASIKALAKAQTEMGKALKNASNPHLKSKYADLGSVMDACFTALHSNGFAVMQPCGRDDFGQYVETILAHESGDTFVSRVHLVIGKPDMQGVGSAITYARRYGLLGMAGLAPEDDDGEAQKAPVVQRHREEAFDPIRASARIGKAIANPKTKQQLAALWKAEEETLRILKDGHPDFYEPLKAEFAAAGAKAIDDPAMQAPNQEAA